MSIHAPTAAHAKFMKDLKGALAANVNLSGAEMLAIASQFVGNLIAAQDQRLYTPESVMNMVASNIQIGNRAALEALHGTQGRA